MRKNYIILFLLCICPVGLRAQTLEQAKAMFKNNEFAKAKPVFQRYVKSAPNNASYNHWYGVCLYETGDKADAEKYLLLGAKKKVQESYRYLGKLYSDLYRFDEAVENYESYIELLEKKKQPTEEYEKLLNTAKLSARMLKGVENVAIIDSFVVDKKDFLKAYKISEESGKLFTYNEYFKTNGDNEGTVYLTELENKLYYGDKAGSKNLSIFTKNKMLDEWGKATKLPDVVNVPGNENYPYVLSDGVTVYYASDGEGSMGGYDIFVTRYNINTDSYMIPDNVGMPFNSPYNDYMFVIDEYNNLGWFASDRYQPEGKVCIYVFIPNSSKQIYDYESTDNSLIRHAAMIQSIKDTWKDREAVQAGKQRLTMALYAKPKVKQVRDFEFIIDDIHTYYVFKDFNAPQAKVLFKQWQQKKKDLMKLSEQLNEMRDKYAQSNKSARASMTPRILDTEKRVEQMEQELVVLEKNVRNEEKKFLSK